MVTLVNDTGNQHFVSQVEQKLNCCNPELKKKKSRIFQYSIFDRKNNLLTLTNANGVKIGDNLSINDLYTFDIVSGSNDRYNFEKYFKAYEDNAETMSRSLLSKALNGGHGEDVKDEVLQLFQLKFLNLIRNPFSIDLVCNLFSALATTAPANEPYKTEFQRVLDAKTQQQKQICQQLGISNDLYIRWLKIIFQLLVVEDKGQNLYDLFVKRYFESADHEIGAHLFTLSNEYCLLPDTGFVIGQLDDEAFTISFNLTSHAYLVFTFVNSVNLYERLNFTPEQIKQFKPPVKHIHVNHSHDDLVQLREYNKGVIQNCHAHVYSGSNTVFV